MANQNINETAAKLEAPLMGQRAGIALKASWQIEKLMEALVSAARQQDIDGLDCLVQAIGTRAYELSGVIMSALDDDAESLQSLSARLNLQRA